MEKKKTYIQRNAIQSVFFLKSYPDYHKQWRYNGLKDDKSKELPKTLQRKEEKKRKEKKRKEKKEIKKKKRTR